MNQINSNHSNREESVLRAKKIAPLLSSTPITAAEINTALGEEYTPLQIANAVKLIPGWAATRVTRAVRTTKGFQVEKEYAAYYLEDPNASVVLEPRKPAPSQPGDMVSARKPTSSKAEQQGQAKAIAGVLTHTPMTALEINAALYSDYTALQVANAVKLIPGTGTCKVRRIATNIKGLKVEKEYTAYFLK